MKQIRGGGLHPILRKGFCLSAPKLPRFHLISLSPLGSHLIGAQVSPCAGVSASTNAPGHTVNSAGTLVRQSWVLRISRSACRILLLDE